MDVNAPNRQEPSGVQEVLEIQSDENNGEVYQTDDQDNDVVLNDEEVQDISDEDEEMSDNEENMIMPEFYPRSAFDNPSDDDDAEEDAEEDLEYQPDPVSELQFDEENGVQMILNDHYNVEVPVIEAAPHNEDEDQGNNVCI